MASDLKEEIATRITESLRGTPFVPTSLTPLTGGTANYIWRASLSAPLEDGTTEVTIKHGEGHSASNVQFKLSQTRCRIEEECFKAVASCPPVPQATNGHGFDFAVRVPKVFHFDKENSTQILEYLPNGTNLKNFALTQFSSPTPASQKQACVQLGAAIGRWLRNFHDWSSKQAQLKEVVAGNVEMQKLKHVINFDWISQRIQRFPAVLSGAEETFARAKSVASAELQDENQLQVIHGDFWSGNVLLPNAAIQENTETQLFVVDWEQAQIGVRNLDIGQMIAELWEIWLYKKIEAGLWILQGFVEGYGSVSVDFAFRTAIQVGAHLVSFGSVVPGWGTPEQNEDIARIGRDVITNALDKNRVWFDCGDLACLFSQAQ